MGDEIEYAIKAWACYTNRRQQMAEAMREFDKSGSGTLDKCELKEYLRSLNGGQEVKDSEVDWVLGEADIFGDGTIATTELVMATAAWFAHVEQKRQSTVYMII